mmetsp:Transcript_15113/g.32447  ORF Transcript_15113/g.32447 Transcript_15113/m.32447 type:complete len:208 (+) Transcript_15113:2362-2985(+)
MRVRRNFVFVYVLAISISISSSSISSSSICISSISNSGDIHCRLFLGIHPVSNRHYCYGQDIVEAAISSKDTRGKQRKGNIGDTFFLAAFQRLLIGQPQQCIGLRIVVPLKTNICRPDRMHHVRDAQRSVAIRSRHNRTSGTAADIPGSFEHRQCLPIHPQTGPTGFVDGSVHTASVEASFVGGIDNRAYAGFGGFRLFLVFGNEEV